MKESIKNEWVKALKSGEYKQTRFNLKAMDGFCCLGVLCDLHAKAVDGKWEVLNNGVELYKGISGTLPETVREWSGLETHGGRFNNMCLSTLNDDGKTFEEIANIIECNWEIL